MAVLCGMPTIHYSARIARLSVHKLFSSCIRRRLVSRHSIVDGYWLPLSDASVICHVVNPRRASQKICGGFLYGVYRPGALTLNWFQRLKWKLEIPQIVILLVNFWRSAIIAEFLRPEACLPFFTFLKKQPIEKIFRNYIPKVFIATPIDVLCSNFVNIWPTENRGDRALLLSYSGFCF